VTTPNYSAIEKSTVVAPGDTIVVSRAPLVYIVGDVQRSGAFYMESGQHLTILNLVSLAQGANRTAAMSHASLIRSTPDGVKTIPFDLNKVMKSTQPNMVLEAGDVVVLPRSGWKDFTLEALPGLTNAVSSAASTALITH
jgi:polysaccharide export outer membrane protein